MAQSGQSNVRLHGCVMTPRQLMTQADIGRVEIPHRSSPPVVLSFSVEARRHWAVKRRELITLLGSAAAWPFVARAQQSGKLPTIGFLGALTPSTQSQWTAAFAKRLHELGWIDGRNVAIEYRWAEGRDVRYAEIAAEYVQRNVDVIV